MFQRNIIHDSSTISGYAEKRCKVTAFFRMNKGLMGYFLFAVRILAISFLAFAICFWNPSDE